MRHNADDLIPTPSSIQYIWVWIETDTDTTYRVRSGVDKAWSGFGWYEPAFGKFPLNPDLAYSAYRFFLSDGIHKVTVYYTYDSTYDVIPLAHLLPIIEQLKRAGVLSDFDGRVRIPTEQETKGLTATLIYEIDSPL